MAYLIKLYAIVLTMIIVLGIIYYFNSEPQKPDHDPDPVADEIYRRNVDD